MKIILYLSNYMIPFVMFYIIGFALLMKRPVYDDFVEGAKSGARMVAGILPTLVGLMVGVGVLRASGFLEALSDILGDITQKIGFPSQLLPVALVKLFSSSAATGLALDIFKQYGPDSKLGMMASLMLSCTDTMLILRGSEEYLQRQGLEFVLIKRACPLCYHFAGCSGLAAD